MGDILLISRRPPRDGDTTIFLNTENGRAYLRRFIQQVPRILQPINEDEVKKWVKYGVVLTKMRE